MLDTTSPTPIYNSSILESLKESISYYEQAIKKLQTLEAHVINSNPSLYHHVITEDLIRGLGLKNSKLSFPERPVSENTKYKETELSREFYKNNQNKIYSFCKLEISDMESRLVEAKKHLDRGNYFLKTLREEPHTLIENLTSRITNEFTTYDNARLGTLYPEERLVLINFKEKLALFSPSKDVKTDQINYLKLCASIYDMKSIVKNYGLGDKINALIYQCHLKEDLPDELATGVSLNEHISILKKEHPNLFNMTVEQLIKDEEIIYQNLNKSFPCAVKFEACKNLTKKINRVQEAINEEINYVKKQNKSVNYALYNKILKVLLALNENPLDQEAAKKAAFYAESTYRTYQGEIPRNRVILRHILNITCMLLSVTAFVLMFLIFVTFPPSIAIALGCSAIAQAALGVAVGATGLAAGVGILAFEDSLKGTDLYRGLHHLSREVNLLPSKSKSNTTTPTLTAAST